MATVTEAPTTDVATPDSPEAEGPAGKQLRIHPKKLLPFNAPVVGWLGLLHVGALAAPFFFSWQGLVAAVVLHWLTGGIGICLGFHRFFTHSSFKTYAPIRYLLALLGGLAGQGSALEWVSSHRKHHALSDQEGDPHSPRDGGWWSHAWWLSRSVYGRDSDEFTKKWAPDLHRDPILQLLTTLAIPTHFVLGGGLFALGYFTSGTFMAWSLVTWGLFFRLVFLLHCTWFVNSASHMWGYRNYETSDDSRNNWWVAVLTYGEGWHNNHHAYPRMANHGHRWFELDVTFWAIRVMRWTGLAWDVVDYKRKSDVA